MEDYREIGPPGNGETRKTGASNLAAVRETTRHVRIHASRVIFRGALSMLDARLAAQVQKHNALKTHKQGLQQQLFPSLDGQ